MRLHIAWLISLVFCLTFGFSGSSFSAEKDNKKKLKTGIANQQGSVTWKEEPLSFLGINLGEPVTSRISQECPKKFSSDGREEVGYTDLSIVEAYPDGVSCYLLNSRFPAGSTGNVRVFPQRVPLLSEPLVTAEGDPLTGKVGKIMSRFDTEDFGDVKRILVAKYGSPHKEVVSMIRTEGGREFENSILDWEGRKISIHVESLVVRYVSMGMLFSSGYVSVRTNDFLRREQSNADRTAQEAASKL